MESQKYVLGFMFSPDGKQVVLIQKTKPLWQKGLLNGVGGKVEPHEIADEAIIREFREETGVEHYGWGYLGRMHSLEQDWKCDLFSTFSPKYQEVKTMTEEVVGVYNVADINSLHIVPNLRFLIPIALYNDAGDGVLISY